MYSVDGLKFTSFMEAIATAKCRNSQVVQIDNGLVRWTPPSPVSAKRKRRYQNQKAAYEAAKKNGQA